ncbi:MAG: S24/S26 family peptidase [Pseudomonadota bacterium]
MRKKSETRTIVLEDGISDEYVELLRDAVASGKSMDFTARGTSMLPFIAAGAKLTVERFSGMPPPVGTICVGAKNGRLQCHRLIAVRERPGGRRQYILRGDNRRFPDEPYVEEDLVGRVTAVRHGLLEVKSEALVLRMAAQVWMRCPRPAMLATAAALRLTRPARRLLRFLRSRL